MTVYAVVVVDCRANIVEDGVHDVKCPQKDVE